MKKTTRMKMDFIRTLLIAIALQTVYTREFLYLPTKITTDFKPIRLIDARCPQSTTDDPFVKSVKQNVRIIGHNLVPVGGFLCFKQKWIVKCSENFFGIRTISHDIKIGQRPSEEECHAGIETPSFPVEECRWFSDEFHEVIYVVRHRTSVYYDIGFDQIVSSEYGYIHCDGKTCNMPENGLFMADNDFRENRAEGLISVKAEFSTNIRGFITHKSMIRSLSFPTSNLEGACVHPHYDDDKITELELILTNGLTIFYDPDLGNTVSSKNDFEDDWQSKEYDRAKLLDFIYPRFGKESSKFSKQLGTWMKYKRTYQEEWLKVNSPIFSTFRNCEESDFRHASHPGTNFPVENEALMIENKMDSLFCRNMLHGMLTENKLNMVGLGQLAPNYGGVGPVYRINGSRLERAYGFYEQVLWKPKGEQLGIKLDNSLEPTPVTCPQWTKTDDGLEHCINGIFRVGDVVYHPVYSVDGETWMENAYKDHGLVKMEHLGISSHPKNLNHTYINWSDLFEGRTRTSFHDINMEWLNFGGIKITMIGVAVIFILVTSLYILRKLKDLMFSNKRGDHYFG